MTHKEMWDEQKKWLENSIAYLKERKEETSGKEQERVKAKLEGLQVSYDHMVESEKMYAV